MHPEVVNKESSDPGVGYKLKSKRFTNESFERCGQ